MSRIGVKGRDMESLLYMGKIKSVNVEYCDEAKKQAKVGCCNSCYWRRSRN